MKKIFIILAVLLSFSASAQETDIIPYLRAVEEGKKDEVLNKLASLKKENPSDPSIMFLEGVLTESAEDALVIFNSVLEKYPKSKYADAALYRIYSYNFASGLYNAAEKNLNRLKNEYSSSPYIKIAERDIPDFDEPDLTAEENAPPEKLNNTGQPGNFTVQAGAFSNRKNSAALLQELRAAGYAAEIKEKLVAGTAFEVVYAGKFATEAEAQSFLKMLNNRFHLDGRVVSTKNAN